MSPLLGRLLLLKLNPISLLALGQTLSVLTAKLFMDRPALRERAEGLATEVVAILTGG